MNRRTLLATLAGLTLAGLTLLIVGASNPWDELRDSFAKLLGSVETLSGKHEELAKSHGKLDARVTDLGADMAGLAARVKALETPPVPPPPPPPPPPGGLELEYLGAFLPPLADPTQTAINPHFRFNFSAAVAALGPTGLYLLGQGHAVCEITIPEPGDPDNPPRAAYAQPFADLGAGGRREQFKQALIRGLCYSKVDQRLYVAFGQNYNVSHSQYPTLCWGPPELAQHVADGTDVLWIEDDAGQRVDHELVAGYVAETSLGLVLAQQYGKHQARSDGPALYVVDKPADGAAAVTGFRRLLAYPRESYLFPDPLYVDGTGGWVEGSECLGVAEIDGRIVFGGFVGLGTGLDNFQGEHVTDGKPWWVRRNSFYGSHTVYPIAGVALCKGGKGFHAPPYQARLWEFDPAEIADAPEPHLPTPQAIINLSVPGLLGENNGCGQTIVAMCWDAETRRLYLVDRGAGPRNGEPLIHVLKIPRTEGE